MKTNQLTSLAAVGVLWLAMGVGCRKDAVDPCTNGECCGLGQVKFVRQVEGARAEYGSIAFNFQELLASNQHGALTCPAQEEMYKTLQLKTNTMIDSNGKVRLIDSTRAYPYRVWGTIYNLVDIIGYGGPVYCIRLDRVESVY